MFRKPQNAHERALKKARSVRSARKRYEELITFLGGECLLCSSKTNLQVHHKFGRDWEPSDLNRWSRVARYWREARQALLECLCGTCNRKVGKPKPEKAASVSAASEDLSDIPF